MVIASLYSASHKEPPRGLSQCENTKLRLKEWFHTLTVTEESKAKQLTYSFNGTPVD